MQVQRDKKEGSTLSNIAAISTFIGGIYLTLEIVEKLTEITIPIFIIVFLGWCIILLSWGTYALVRGKFKDVDEKIDSLTNLVNKILGWINKTDNNFPLSANSPLALNEKGGKMANDMAADDIIDAHKNSLIKKLNALNIKNAYDVQVACLSMTNETWAEVLAPETLDKIKELAFSKGIELEHYYKVLGLKLRDVILSKRNEKLDDVDKHSPDDSTD